MASSRENKIARVTIDPITGQADASSHQHLFFANWLQTRDSSIFPPKEAISKFYHESNGVEDQNRARSAIRRKPIENESKRAASAHCTFGVGSISSNEKCTSRKEPEVIKSKIPVITSEMTRPTVSNPLSPSLFDKRPTSGNKKSKIPVPINARHPVFPKQNTIVNNSITSDLEKQAFFDQEEVSNKIPSFQFIELPLNCDINSSNDNCDLSSLKPIQNIDTNELDTLVPSQKHIPNENFETLMRKQNELKVYYDSFPNIDNATNETNPDIEKAKEFTNSILHNLPSGDVDDRDTLCHVLHKLLGKECLFYDSENGINLYDASMNLADMNSEDRPFVLKLSSSEGLGNIKNMKMDQDDLKLVQILTNAIEKNQSHPVLEDIIKRLSEVYSVDQKSIIIKNVFFGSFNIVYTILDLATHTMESLKKNCLKLKKQFKKFVSLKIHPLLFRPSFDIGYFDKRGNKAFSDKNKTFEVGPPDHTHLYTQATGWTRYGLKVLGKYSDDTWLDPFQHPGNWYRAFHGTGRAQSQDFEDTSQSFEKQYVSVDALASIYFNGFHLAREHVYGEGVYCSPNPTFPENGYVFPVPLDTKNGEKTFKCMLQVAVNPDGVTKHNDVWVVPKPKDIRPYGILIKEA